LSTKRALADTGDWRRGYEGRHGGLDDGGAICIGRAFAAASAGRDFGKSDKRKDVRLSGKSLLVEQ